MTQWLRTTAVDHSFLRSSIYDHSFLLCSRPFIYYVFQVDLASKIILVLVLCSCKIY